MNHLSTRFFVLLVGVMFCAQANISYGQGSSDSNTVDVSEILIPQCEKIKHQKNVYYEVYTSQDHLSSPSYWYKILFNKDCSFHFSLFPVYEEDTYDFFCFKLESDKDICNAITENKIISCNTERVYKDYNDEVVKTKVESKFVDLSDIKVKAGDAIYIEILSTRGKDCGHILDFKTSSSLFVSKLINRKCPTKENYNSDITISMKKYQTIQTEAEAIELLSKTFCKIKKDELMVTSIKIDRQNATFNPGLDFVTYARKQEGISANSKSSGSLPKATSLVSNTNVFVLTSIKKDSVMMSKQTIPATPSTIILPPKVTPDDTIKKTSTVKSTADLAETTLPNKEQLQANSNAFKHARLMVDNAQFSTLLEEIEGKIENNNKLIKSYSKQLKKADTKEQKAETTSSIKQIKQQNAELKVKMRETKFKLKTIQKLLDQSEKKKK